MSTQNKRLNTFGFQSACYYTWETIPKPKTPLLKPFNEAILYFTQYYSTYSFDTIIAFLPHSLGDNYGSATLELNRNEENLDASPILRRSKLLDPPSKPNYPNYPYNLSNHLAPYKMRLKTPQNYQSSTKDTFRTQPPYSEIGLNRYSTSHNYFTTPRPSVSTISKSINNKQLTDLSIKLGYGKVWNVSIPPQDWNIEFDHLTTIQMVCKYEPEILVQSLLSLCALAEALAILCKDLRSSLSKNTFITIGFLVRGLSTLKDNTNMQFTPLQDILFHLKKDDREALRFLTPNLLIDSSNNSENNYKTNMPIYSNEQHHLYSVPRKFLSVSKNTFAVKHNRYSIYDYPNPPKFQTQQFDHPHIRTKDMEQQQESKNTTNLETKEGIISPSQTELNVYKSHPNQNYQLKIQTSIASIENTPNPTKIEPKNEISQNTNDSNLPKDSNLSPASATSAESQTSTQYTKPYDTQSKLSISADLKQQKLYIALCLAYRCLKPLIHQSISDKKFISESAYEAALMLVTMSTDMSTQCLNIFRSIINTNNAKTSYIVSQLLHYLTKFDIQENTDLDLATLGEMVAELLNGRLPSTRQITRETLYYLYKHFQEKNEYNFFETQFCSRLRFKPNQRKLINDTMNKF